MSTSAEALSELGMRVSSVVKSDLVEVSGVSFGYDRSPVLHDVDYVVEAGEFTGIVGPSGSGKTSLLRLLLGTVRPQRGTVTRLPGVATYEIHQNHRTNEQAAELVAALL